MCHLCVLVVSLVSIRMPFTTVFLLHFIFLLLYFLSVPSFYWLGKVKPSALVIWEDTAATSSKHFLETLGRIIS